MSSPEPIVRFDHTNLPAPATPPSAGGSMLDALWEYIAEEVESPPVTLEVPKRPNVTVRFNTVIAHELWRAWLKKATKGKQGREETDWLQLAYTVLANQCEAILFNGDEVTVDGRPLTFASPELRQQFGGGTVQDAILALYVLDVHVKATADRIINEAGFFDEVESADPTVT